MRFQLPCTFNGRRRLGSALEASLTHCFSTKAFLHPRPKPTYHNVSSTTLLVYQSPSHCYGNKVLTFDPGILQIVADKNE